MAADGDLYRSDFYAWTQAQGRAIRAAGSGGNAPVDWENVAEEIETLGRSERREVTSRIGTIIEHLLKLSVSPAEAPRRGWIAIVRRTRRDVRKILSDNPSLRPELPSLIESEHGGIPEIVAGDLETVGELSDAAVNGLQTLKLTPEQVLGDWLPERPG